MMTIAELAKATLESMDERGWVPYAAAWIHDAESQGPLCVAQHAGNVLNEHGRVRNDIDFWTEFRKALCPGYSSIGVWNDQRTEAEVRAALQALAEKQCP
jgi:hypothetical protein